MQVIELEAGSSIPIRDNLNPDLLYVLSGSLTIEMIRYSLNDSNNIPGNNYLSQNI
jgi:hypothetical protein